MQGKLLTHVRHAHYHRRTRRSSHLESGLDRLDLAQRLESKVSAAARDLADGLGGIFRKGIDPVSCAEGHRQLALLGHRIHGDDRCRSGDARTLNDREPHSATADHGNPVTRLDIGGIERGPCTRGHSAADKADGVEGNFFVDLDGRSRRHHGVLCEGGDARHLVNGVPALLDAGGAVEHGGAVQHLAHGGAEEGLALSAHQTFPTRG